MLVPVPARTPNGTTLSEFAATANHGRLAPCIEAVQESHEIFKRKPAEAFVKGLSKARDL